MLHMEQKDYKFEIVNFLLSKESHVRGIAKTLDINHMTIQRKINELKMENVVDFREEGRNKVFFLKRTIESKSIIYQTENYKLIKTLEKYPELRKIIEIIKKNQKIKLAILFGSYAKGIAKKSSDVDVFLETTDIKLKNEISDINSRLNIKIGKYKKDSLLIKEIEKNHVVIKGVELYYEKNKLFENP